MKIRFLLLVLLLLKLNSDSFSQTVVNMKRDGGVSIIPCKVNGLNLNFIFDTGASDISLSMTEATFMLKNDYLSVKDIIGSKKFTDANGNINEGVIINLKEIEIAGLMLYNLKASVVKNNKAPLLLGQSAIGKLGKIQLDLEKNTLTILSGNSSYDFSDNKQQSIQSTNTQPKESNNLVVGNSIKIGNLEVAEYDFAKKMNWQDAKAACASLGYGWRLPSNSELNLMFKNKNKIGSFENQYYWSSTDNINNGNEYNAYALSILFSDGFQNELFKGNNYYVRAVRIKSEKSTDNPKQLTNHRVIGNSIKLRNIEVAEYEFQDRMNWYDASAACAALGNGWRLPTIAELSFLYEQRTVVSGFANIYYWSSTESDIRMAWAISKSKLNELSGFKLNREKISTYNARAVRSY